jgi:uncharacterized membrane protein YhaH (DUF805 family)
MTHAIVFLLDVLLALLICIGIVAYVQKQLRLLLVELCGIAERASFWLIFCNVVLVLVPLIFILSDIPGLEANKNTIFVIAEQIKYTLIGIVMTLGGFALVLLRYIPRNSAK